MSLTAAWPKRVCKKAAALPALVEEVVPLVFSFEPNLPGIRSPNIRSYMIESTLKIARCCPLVIQGFSNFLNGCFK